MRHTQKRDTQKLEFTALVKRMSKRGRLELLWYMRFLVLFSAINKRFGDRAPWLVKWGERAKRVVAWVLFGETETEELEQ
jgi:hypothetical protein